MSGETRHAHVCPWWLGYLLASPVRRLFQNPRTLLAPYVRGGMTVLEPGPGMGFFTLDLARLVGPAGRVVAVDIQPRMLAGLRRRAAKAGLAERIETRVVSPGSLGVDDLAGRVDLACAFAVVHEVPDAPGFFRELARAVRPGGVLLLVEPAGHVKPPQFEDELAAAAAAGLAFVRRFAVAQSHAAELRRDGEPRA